MPRLALLSVCNRLFLALGIFIVVAFWAVIKPVGADPDESIHLIHAWCGDAGSSGRCPTSKSNNDLQLVPFRIASGLNCVHTSSRACGKTRYLPLNNWADASCQNSENENLLVEVEKHGMGNYPRPLKQLQGLVIGSDPDTSVIRIRLLSALVATICIGGSTCIIRDRRLKVWLYLILMANPFVLSLLASANPSSWAFSAAIGSGVLLLGLNRTDFLTTTPLRRSRIIACAAFLTITAYFSRPEIRILVSVAGVILMGAGVLRALLAIGKRRTTLSLMVLFLGLLAVGLTSIFSRVEKLLVFRDSDLHSHTTGLPLTLYNLGPGLRFVAGSVVGFPDGIYATALSPWFYLIPFSLLYLLGLLRAENRQHLWRNIAVVFFAVLLTLSVVLMVYQSTDQSIPGVIQPRYLAPVSIVAVATVIRLTNFQISRRAVSVIVFTCAIGLPVGMAHNMLRYISGVKPNSSISSVWELILGNHNSHHWWQDSLPLEPHIVFVIATVVYWRMAYLGKEIVPMNCNRKTYY